VSILLITGVPKLRSEKSQKADLTSFQSFTDRDLEVSRTFTSRMPKLRYAKSRSDMGR
jgi:hypothetical protein